MFYLVRMVVSPPYGMPPEEFERLKAEEKEVGIRLQREGIWKHIWRVAGAYAHVSIFEVDSVEQLRSEEQTSELQSLMRISYAVFCLKKKKVEPIGLIRKD